MKHIGTVTIMPRHAQSTPIAIDELVRTLIEGLTSVATTKAVGNMLTNLLDQVEPALTDKTL